MNQSSETDFAIIGGGVVGLSIAYGLSKLGLRVRVFDEGDNALRASRGNFGLVWIQGKGLTAPPYAQWSQQSAKLWGTHAQNLQLQTGVSLGLEQQGGYSFFTEEAELEKKVEKYRKLKKTLNGDYPFEVLGHNALRKEEPEIGPDVVGAILHHQDGHVNPLKLLRALAEQCRAAGVEFSIAAKVQRVEQKHNEFVVTAGSQQCRAEKVVLCAGLGSVSLATDLGFKAPVKPNRGQVLITEKLPPLIRRPNLIARQVDEGAIQIGASEEDVGLDTTDSLSVSAALATQAIKTFPVLGKVNLVRHWSALRVMSPDGLPIYQQSVTHPGAFYVTCHSGITLSAIHAEQLPQWLTGSSTAPDLSFFSEDRFSV